MTLCSHRSPDLSDIAHKPLTPISARRSALLQARSTTRTTAMQLSSNSKARQYVRVPSPSFSLPNGWDLDRVRFESGDPNAQILEIVSQVLLVDGNEYIELEPAIIVNFSGRCLLRIADDTAWYMGSLQDDGSIVCWGSYGDDLGEAIKAF